MTKYEQIRAEAISKVSASGDVCGKAGKIFEIECARKLSKKSGVAGVNEIDVHIKIMNDNGKITYKAAECKTNGGRIDNLMDGTNRAPFVIYRLDYVQKNRKSTEHRQIPAVVIPTELFTAMLAECNAIKTVAHNGIVDGLAIQVSSKRMYERLTAYVDNYGEAIIFDNDRTYEEWDFEGLEI